MDDNLIDCKNIFTLIIIKFNEYYISFTFSKTHTHILIHSFIQIYYL